MHEQTQPADAGAAFDHRHEVVRLGPLGRAAQVQLLRREHQPFLGNPQPPRAVGLRHVEHDLFVGQQLVVQRQVVAVGVQPRLIERIDDDVAAQVPDNFVAGKDHGRLALR